MTPAPQHTPGPWRMVRFAARRDRMERLSHVEYHDGEAWHKVTLHITDELADRMVCGLNAEPDLLAAGEKLLRFASIELEDDGPHEACDAMRAAIAKAKGGAR